MRLSPKTTAGKYNKHHIQHSNTYFPSGYPYLSPFNNHPPPDVASGSDSDYADGDDDDGGGGAHSHAHGDVHANVYHHPSVYLPESCLQ